MILTENLSLEIIKACVVEDESSRYYFWLEELDSSTLKTGISLVWKLLDNRA